MDNLGERDKEFVMQTLETLVTQSFSLYWRIKLADTASSRIMQRILSRKFDSIYQDQIALIQVEQGTVTPEAEARLRTLIQVFSSEFMEERRIACERHLNQVKKELIDSDIEYLVRIYDSDTIFRSLLQQIATDLELEMAVTLREVTRSRFLAEYLERKNRVQIHILTRELVVNEQAISSIQAYSEDHLARRIGLV